MNADRQFAVEVVERLRKAGFVAYWAGGCVRDDLLGQTPKDYDVATGAQPDEIREVFGKRRTLPIGAAFGVITVLGKRGQGQIEVATFRQDAAYSDGRRPDSVQFSTPQNDAQRRDFTINGLFYDPIEDEVIDFVGGREDLNAKIIRAIGDADARIDEDKLRMLRAVRFAATYGFAIQPETLAAIQRHAAELRVVSAERITDEMRRMLRHVNRAKAVQLAQNANLLAVILPEAAANSADDNAWQTTLEILEALGERGTFVSALATLLRGTGGPPLSHWRLSNDELQRLNFLLQHETDIRTARQIPWPRLQRILIDVKGVELIDYCEAVAHVLDGHTKDIDFCRAKLALSPEELNPPPLLTGDDLRDAGIPPGKAYRELLEATRDAQLNGEIDSTEAAFAMAMHLHGERGT